MELEKIYDEVIRDLKCIVACRSRNNSELQIFGNAVKLNKCAQKLLTCVKQTFIDVLGGQTPSNEETLFDIEIFFEDNSCSSSSSSSAAATPPVLQEQPLTNKRKTTTTTTTRTETILLQQPPLKRSKNHHHINKPVVLVNNTNAAIAPPPPLHPSVVTTAAAAAATTTTAAVNNTTTTTSTNSSLAPIVTSRPVPSPQLFSPPPQPLLPPLHGRENKRKRGREPKNEERSEKRARQQKETEKQVEEIIELIEKKDYGSAYAIAHVYSGLNVKLFKPLLGKTKMNTCSICRTEQDRIYPMYPCGCEYGVQVCRNCLPEYMEKLYIEVKRKKMGIKPLQCACCTVKHKSYMDLNVKFYRHFWSYMILTAQMGRTPANGEKIEVIIKWLLSFSKMFREAEYEELKKKYKEWHEQNLLKKKMALL